MRDLIVKLRSYKDTKEWQDQIQSLRDLQVDQNVKLLEGPNPDEELKLYSLADFLRHEIRFLGKLKDSIKIKDKETREAIIEGVQRNIDGRINTILGKTRQFKMENILEGDSFTQEDLWRTENYWIEWLGELPETKANELEIKEREKATEELAKQEADYQQQLDALNVLESEGL